MSRPDIHVAGFPHGTPRGYRDGCRSRGGCTHRGTTLMTCVEAHIRYNADRDYRRRYDAGDIILDSVQPVDKEAEKKRDALARRTVPGYQPHHNGPGWAKEADDQLGLDRTPRPARKPAATPTPPPADDEPTVPAGEGPTTEDRNALEGPAPEGPTIVEVYAHLEEALAEVLRLNGEVSALKAALATATRSLHELAGMRRPGGQAQTLQAGVVGFDLDGQALTISLRGLLAGDDVTRLRRYLALSTLGGTE